MHFRKLSTLFCIGFYLAIAPAFLLGSIALVQIPVRAQQITSATITEILDSDRVFIQGQKARINSVARSGQQVRTERARAGLKFNNNAAIRLGRNSSFIVGSRCVQIRQGRAVISGSVRGCVGSVIAATRGTVYVIEVNEKREGTISVLEGEIEVSDLEDPSVEAISLREKQRVSVSAEGEIGAIEQFSQEEFENLLRGQLFNSFNVALPTASALLDNIALSGSNSQTQNNSGFSQSFLSNAISGSSDPLSSSSSSSNVSVRSSAATIDTDIPDPIANSTVINATVNLTTYDTPIAAGINQDSGIFTDENGTTFMATVERGDFPTIVNLSQDYVINGNIISTDATGNVLINGIVAESTSVGLSGNNAVVTVVGQDGQVLRLQVFNVDGEEPIAGQTYSGQIIFGPLLDR